VRHRGGASAIGVPFRVRPRPAAWIDARARALDARRLIHLADRARFSVQYWGCRGCYRVLSFDAADHVA
jgi:hypothetical protein